MKNQNQNSSDDIIWIIVVCVLLLFGFLYAWNAYHNEVLAALRVIKKGETYLFSFLDPAWEAFDRQLEQADPASVPLETVTGVYNSWSRWLWTPLLLALAWRCYNIPTFRRLYTPQTLLEAQKDVFPPIMPFVKRDIGKESDNLGEWRLADTPLLFLVRNRLIFSSDGLPIDVSAVFNCGEYDGFYARAASPRETPLPLEKDALNATSAGRDFILRTKYLAAEDREKFGAACLTPREDSVFLYRNNFLDEPALATILIKQIGPRIEGDPFEFLKEHAGKNGAFLYHLAVAMYAAGHSDKSKNESWESICALSACFDNATPWADVVIDSPVSPRILEKYPPAQCETYRDYILRPHGHYVYPFLMALYYQARERGVFPDSWFAWLRYYDRTAWYALAQVGGRCAWAEALGAWTHFNAEKIAPDPSVIAPYVLAGIRGLRGELVKEGWLRPEE